MKSENVFVRPNLVIEPLWNRWYAWSYLVSPVTSALYLVNQHLKILQSFVSAPHIHAKALLDRKMIGGPFVDHPATKVAEIRALMEHTVAGHAQVLAFARAIRDLHQMLEENADGHSLEPLYEKVPEPVRGYVELVYDLSVTRDMVWQRIIGSDKPTRAPLSNHFARYIQLLPGSSGFLCSPIKPSCASQPGKPTDNPFIESFNGSFRDECLNTHWFLSLDDARQKIESWRQDYHHFRTHSSLADITPSEFAAGFTLTPTAEFSSLSRTR